MNAVLPFAEQKLAKHGEFFPFGGVMKTGGEITHVAGYDGREQPYQIREGEVVFGEPFAEKGEASVFNSK